MLRVARPLSLALELGERLLRLADQARGAAAAAACRWAEACSLAASEFSASTVHKVTRTDSANAAARAVMWRAMVDLLALVVGAMTAL
jgi:hypothetical protein